jgi:alcohol dehydrogenase
LVVYPIHGVCSYYRGSVAAAASVVPVPAELPLEQAALFGCALLTGVGAVLNTAKAEPGSTALVVGLGGVGLAAVMGARLAGCQRVVAVDLDAGKLELAEEVGATDVLAAGPEAVEQVRDLTGGGADYAFEAAGHPDALALAYAATARGGTTVGIGLPHPDQRFSLPALSLVAEERRLVGSYMGSAVPRRDIPRYIQLFMDGRMPVGRLAGGTFRLEEVNEAVEALAGGAVARQVVLMPDG